MADYNCTLCIHQNVCPAYMAARIDCKEYLPIGNLIPMVRCRECQYYNAEQKACTHLYALWNVFDTSFCSYGTKKEGDAEC